ncbi:MAG: leucine-rich repeat domain-containing protein [Treponema sp.]|nr:leucine-rich repeat domain-containing protein [Treponema sp.]
MKKTRKTGIFAFIIGIAFVCAFIACADSGGGTSAHTHDWGEWTQKKAPTATEDGEDERVCALDPSHRETRSIPKIPFTSVADFNTWLTIQDTNTAATAYKVSLNVADISSPDSLKTTLTNAMDKYVYLDLSGSTFTVIAASDLAGCNRLTGITIPKSVNDIKNRSFTLRGLTEIIVDPANTAYSSQNGVLYDKAKTRLIQYPVGKTDVSSFTIPNSVTVIGDSAFGGQDSLTSVTIPNSVASIEDYAFTTCSVLTRVIFQGTIPASAFSSNMVFNNMGDLRDKFYATNATNGTPGTYTTTLPLSDSSVWTKEP